jgi:hypothetical protein
MKFTKNIMGMIATLILVILLTQSRLFDFLTETPLGRMVLLAFIILISYTNKILGLLAVLVIAIAFNQYDMKIFESYKRYEGFDVSGNVNGTIELDSDEVNMLKLEEKIMQEKLKEAIDKMKNESKTSTTTSSDSSTNKVVGGREGFCMVDRELTILRGKQSNTIPVFNNSREQDDDDNISPSDKSVFSNLFSVF